MKTPAFLPSPPEVARETLVVLAGAVLAAFIVGQLPALRNWIKAQWGSAAAPSVDNIS